MKISLMVISAGAASGKSLPVTLPQFIIGRDPQCNLRPASVMISKRHCAVLVKNNQVFLRDFDSTNGTFLNDQPVKGEVQLADGDMLKVGPLSFKVVIEGMPAPSKPTPLPKSKNATAASDEDDAAAFLSFADEDGEVDLGQTISPDESVPVGTTAMDIPAVFKDVPQPEATEKPKEENKPNTKTVARTGAAQDAAKALLERLRTGKRK